MTDQHQITAIAKHLAKQYGNADYDTLKKKYRKEWDKQAAEVLLILQHLEAGTTPPPF